MNKPFLKTTNFREIYINMLENYKNTNKIKENSRDLSKFDGLVIEDTYDKEHDEDSLENILLLLKIIKKEKGI